MSSEEEEEKSSMVKLDLLIKQFSKFSKLTERKLEENNVGIKKILELQEAQAKEIKALKAENKELNSKVTQLSKKVDFLERQTLDNAIQFVNIPKVEGESLPNIIKTIAGVVNVNLSSFNFVKLFRRQEKRDGKPGDIIMYCNTQAVKDNLIQLLKEKKLVLSDIGFEDNNRKVYVNEMLTSTMSEIFYNARKIKNKQNWKFLWISKGNVLLKKKEGDRVIKIESLDHLNSIGAERTA